MMVPTPHKRLRRLGYIILYTFQHRLRNQKYSSEGIVSGYKLNERTKQTRFAAKAAEFSFLYSLQISPESQTVHQWALSSLSAGVKRPGRATDTSLFIPEVKNDWRYTATRRGAQLNTGKFNLTFVLK
jgi:hypothetical protein